MTDPSTPAAPAPPSPPPRPAERYVPRFDVSAVPPVGAYAAKRCPLRVQYDAFPPPETEPLPSPAVAEHRAAQGVAYEAEVVADLAALHTDLVRIDPELPTAERELATAAAMAGGAALIAGGRLPTDEAGRRVGQPDLLVRAERRPDRRWAYLPVDIKHHKTISEADDRTLPVSTLVAPARSDAEDRTDRKASSSRRDDGLQLAHYVRMLAACGHDSERPDGGIIGKERLVVWHDLAERDVPQLWSRAKDQRESLLERYDFELAFRLDVLAAAMAGEPIVEPVLLPECSGCPWRGRCIPEMEAADSVALVQGIGYPQWHALRRLGIRTRADLAALHHHTARVRDLASLDGVDLDALVEAAASAPADTGIDRLLPDHPPPPVETFAELGVERASDLLALHPATVATDVVPTSRLAELIDLARVATAGGGRPHVRRGLDRVVVPTADVEVDIDMENALDGTVYLWGALLHDQYVPFTTWVDDDPAAEAQVFVDFWTWLAQVRHQAAEAGRTVAVHCWSRHAELSAMQRGARLAQEQFGRSDLVEAVEELVAGPELVDLLVVYRDQVITGAGNGLKAVAPLSGFAWRDDDPGGDKSMLWHRIATTDPDPAARSDARDRLLAYNEDDVRATAAVRTWLRTATLPHAADL